MISEGYGTVLSRLLSFTFPTWTIGVQISYPLGTSSADANLARARLQLTQSQIPLRNIELQVTTSVRDVARQVVTNQKRVEATAATRNLMEQRLTAEQKKFAAGMSTNFLVFQAQRDLADAQNNWLSAVLDYNRSLVDFETVQEAPTAGSSSVVLPGATATGVTSGTASSSGGYSRRRLERPGALPTPGGSLRDSPLPLAEAARGRPIRRPPLPVFG